ncbi:potassium channel family protein [Rhodococcus daqingensis]|uniref:Potassium channel family protein n=1 Tax=Rhodococcus daqingensis TaxID=2479363 RepID=A0ABW2S4D1_9NOCA
MTLLRSSRDAVLTVASLVFLAAYAVPILVVDLPPGLRFLCDVTMIVTWVAFVLDYGDRLVRARGKWDFVRANLFELVALVLPLLRPLRLVVVLAALSRSMAGSFRGRVGAYVVGGTGLLVFCAALAVLDAERANPEANIRGFGDALWWGMTTVTTVGYGDRYPTTSEGRLIAFGLMLGGVALLGVVTASLASWFVERVAAAQEDGSKHAADEIHRLTAEIADLNRRLAEQGTAGSAHKNAPAESAGASLLTSELRSG